MEKIIQLIEIVIRDIDHHEKKPGSKSWKQIALNAKSTLSFGLREFNVSQDCEWEGHDETTGEVWYSGCGEASYLDPSENDYNYCPYCGKSIESHFVDSEDEEEGE